MGIYTVGNISDKMAFWGRCTVSSLGVGRSKETERNLVRISIKNRGMNEFTAVGGPLQRTIESNVTGDQSWDSLLYCYVNTFFIYTMQMSDL